MPGRHRLQDGMAGDLKKGRAVKYNRNVYQALTMITQFGINMLVPAFWMILLFFVGARAGFTNVFRFARRIYETPAVTRRRRQAPDCKTVTGSGERHEEED